MTARDLRHRIEAAILAALMALLGALPLDRASALGGWLGKTIGMRMGVTRTARRNLAAALPELDESAREKIITGMWENLGRVIGEYPHLEKIGSERIEAVIPPAVDTILRAGAPCIIIAGHCANWEICAAAMLKYYGRSLDLAYRALNNPHADAILLKARTLGGKVRCYSKSREGGRDMLKALRDGRMLGILIDQKYNEGIAAPFFGRPAMTNPAFAQFALKFNLPVLPARIERIGGAHFRITMGAPLPPDGQTAETMTAQANALLESWIRQNPAQWLWLHRRWDSQKLSEQKDTP